MAGLESCMMTCLQRLGCKRDEKHLMHETAFVFDTKIPWEEATVQDACIY